MHNTSNQEHDYQCKNQINSESMTVLFPMHHFYYPQLLGHMQTQTSVNDED